MNCTIICLWNRFPHYSGGNSNPRRAMLKRLCRDIAAYPQSIRPDRFLSRNNPRDKRFFRKKSVLP